MKIKKKMFGKNTLLAPGVYLLSAIGPSNLKWVLMVF